MTPLEFLADVLPSPGHGLYCVARLSKTRKEHQFVEALEEIKPHVKRWLGEKKDVYFALAVFDPVVQTLTKERRTAANARFVKSIFIDMDGYPTRKDAALALDEFLQSTGLDSFGTPHIVSSGGGLHCYWPLTEEADIETWKPIAENFKRLCAQENLRIDQTVTADAARVMRIPNTLNFKPKYGEPRPVKMLLQGSGPIDMKRFGATVRALLKPEFAPVSNNFKATSVNLEGTRPSKSNTKRSALTEALINNSVTRFETIWLKTENGRGCKQIAHYRDHAHEDGMEPLWRALLSWTKVCEDGYDYSLKLTELHPYTLERMQKKLQDIKGPYPCVKLDSENPGICPSCPHWGKITNALALGREIVAATTEKTYEVPLLPNAPDIEADTQYLEDGITSDLDEEGVEQNKRTRTAVRGLPPKGFIFSEHGGVFVEIKEKDATGVEIKSQIPVIKHDLFVLDILRMEEKEHHAHLMAIKNIGTADKPEERVTEYTPIILPAKTVVAKDELLKCLASHNVYADHGTAMDQYLYNYVRASIAEAASTRRAVDVPIQFGWQKDGSFVYNNRIFRPDGKEIAVPMPGLENINRDTSSKGTIEGWRRQWNLLAEKDMLTMLFLCVDSFGSTLMRFSEYEGFVWHIGSTGSGTGKSLTLSLKAGVWGHPIRYRTGKGTSPVALQQRAGLLNSMPLLIDEITAKSRADTEWVPSLIFDISEGKGKERMESGTNKERLNNSIWALTATLTSNMHMTDVMTGARTHSSHGEMMRMLEWTPTKELVFNESERKILRGLRRNYGVAGEAWVRWIVKNQRVSQDIWMKTHEHLRKAIGFSDEERYWHAAITSTISAGILLGEKYSGLLTLPIVGMTDAAGELVEKARAAHRGSVRTAEDILNAYTRDYYGKFVVLRRSDDDKLVTEWNGSTEGKTSTRHTVAGRIEHAIKHPNFVEYFIEEQLLKRHCAAMSFGYADFRHQFLDRDGPLVKAGYVAKFGVKKDMLARTDGPALRVSVMHLTVPKALVGDEGVVSMGKA